jgi:DNA-binding XRE family transcriptional regulator
MKAKAKMKLGKNTQTALKGPFSKYKPRTKLTPGYMIRHFRELQSMTQADLAEKSGLKQATISGLEHDRITLGLDRAKALARALKVHPAVLAFPGWDVEKESAA